MDGPLKGPTRQGPRDPRGPGSWIRASVSGDHYYFLEFKSSWTFNVRLKRGKQPQRDVKLLLKDTASALSKQIEIKVVKAVTPETTRPESGLRSSSMKKGFIQCFFLFIVSFFLPTESNK